MNQAIRLFSLIFLLTIVTLHSAMAQESDSTVVESIDPDHVFNVVEIPPSFPEGMPAFYEYIKNNLKYPQEASELGIEGRVYLSFVINQAGETEDVKVVKGLGGGCSEEAIRILKASPKWNPGIQRGKPVKVRMIIPILFKLTDSKKGKKKKKN